LPAGQDLDRLIHQRLFGVKDETQAPPAYSVDPAAAAKVRAKIKSVFGHPVVVGETRMGSPRKCFARYDSDPSTATEVLAETQALALCRLAALLLKRG
jgi:hypothetical protein